jgi:hypothetical protein
LVSGTRNEPLAQKTTSRYKFSEKHRPGAASGYGRTSGARCVIFCAGPES